eukprot:7232819-Pyramimonas_sp.AAC.1
MPSFPPQSPSGETRGPFTLDVFNCMVGTSATSKNSSDMGDMASSAPARRQRYPGSVPNDYNESVGHAVLQTGCPATCKFQYVPTIPELLGQIQWRIELSWDYRGMLLHPFADLALRMHPPRPSTGAAMHHVYTDASMRLTSPELAAF